jgi:glycosyltransferase involved in cell wall biosynthesis
LNKYKVCVYAICKNEEQFVDRWMDAVSEADMVVVTDTGSSDNTAEKLRARGALVYTEVINPWRFDVARNIAMDHIPEDVDICVSNDLDEIFELGWRQKLEAEWQPFYTRARYLFSWSYSNDGTPSKQFSMEKIHRRHGFRWVHPVHEVLE